MSNNTALLQVANSLWWVKYLLKRHVKIHLKNFQHFYAGMCQHFYGWPLSLSKTSLVINVSQISYPKMWCRWIDCHASPDQHAGCWRESARQGLVRLRSRLTRVQSLLTVHIWSRLTSRIACSSVNSHKVSNLALLHHSFQPKLWKQQRNKTGSWNILIRYHNIVDINNHWYQRWLA